MEVFVMSKHNETLITFLFLMSALFLFQGIAYPQPIPFETIDKGDYSYYRGNDPDFSGAEIVIRDRESWAWFWRKHTGSIQPPLTLPQVDFRTEMVVAVILGYQTSGGGPSIEISSIGAIFGYYVFPVKAVRVLVKENRTPGPLDVITNPYHIVKVAKSNSVIFDHRPSDKTCSNNLQCAADEFCKKNVGDCEGKGICEAKPGACSEIYAPVCGCDGKTYGNECEAAAAGVSIVRWGECNVVSGCMVNWECGLKGFCLFPEGKCSGPGKCMQKPKVCPLYYGPVCGCDMNTYGNQCEAYGNGVSISYAGECK
jgi:hypothetical protein